MEDIIISNLKDNSLACNLCGSRDTRHVATYVDGHNEDSWFRCLNCKKEYGSQLHFYKMPDGSMKIKTEMLWKRDFKEQDDAQ